jgi:hypothetical protein
LQPLTPSLNLDIGGSFLSPTTIAKLTTGGFAATTIGRDDSSGDITLGDNVTFNNPVILRSQNGINTAGSTLTGAGDITLLANEGITTGTIINPGGRITISSNSGNIDTSAGMLNSSTNGNGGAIALVSTGDITTGDILTNGAAQGELLP